MYGKGRAGNVIKLRETVGATLVVAQFKPSKNISIRRGLGAPTGFFYSENP